MANLIPPDAKRAVMIEYWIRVVTVWVGLIALSLVVVAALMAPTYVLVKAQLEASSTQYEEAADETAQFEEAQSSIVEANELAALLSSNTDVTYLSDTLTTLDDIAGSGVEIYSFSLSRTDGVISDISVNGTAATRQSLAAFSEDIEAHPLFSDAKLPISNLAKDRDIGFSIEITPATES